MGSSQSSLVSKQPVDSNIAIDQHQGKDEGGRKYTTKDTIPALKRSSVSVMQNYELEEITASETTSYHQSFKSIVEVVSEDDESSVSSQDSEDFDDEEDWEERLRILEDARNLKNLAAFFLHPEAPVDSSVCVTRCYFDRASGPEQISKDEADERAMILQEARVLKQSAVDYLHPEVRVTTQDPTAGARCYFSRASAPEHSDDRAAILADAAALKAAAVDYLHPECPVVSSPSACARNYFTRAGAVVLEDAESRDQVLADAKALKEQATFFMHPELPVAVTDPTCCGRNFFNRPSGVEQESDHQERTQVLQDVAALKELAVAYQHPEIPVVTTDPTACGRNYFDRVSSDGYDGSDDRSEVLADAAALKEYANQYRHPERSVTSSVGGRNYFSRPSAPEYEAERDQILADMKALKEAAVAYLHPEIPVRTTDPFACGRNYFSRPSAASFDDDAVAHEKSLILQDIASLKQAARDFAHPELPVESSIACARNYFSRPSAPETEDTATAAQREAVLADIKAMKQLAVDYRHPEVLVKNMDPLASGRNYFSRPSAPEVEDMDDAVASKMVLQDAKALKEAADHYMHPEKPVTSSANCVRNFFDRPSAVPTVEDEEALERERILADARALKQTAIQYLHPERPVVTTDPTATGRNFFDRLSHTLHNQMVHTFPPHEDEHDHHDEHVDHFGMDDDMLFSEFRSTMAAPIEQSKPKVLNNGGSDVGSNLSRSPSSIMLFNEEYTD